MTKLTLASTIVSLIISATAAGCSSFVASDIAVKGGEERSTVAQVHTAEPPLSARIDLDSGRVKQGELISGRLTVTNLTKNPITLYANAQGTTPGDTRCGAFWTLALKDSRTTYMALPQLTCNSLVTLAPGSTISPVQIPATYRMCSTGDSSAVTKKTLPACLPDGNMPSLPAGRYEVIVYSNSTQFPLPLPVPLEITG